MNIYINFSGKAISGVLDSAEKNQIKVAAFCGNIDLEGRMVQDLGIIYSDSVMNHALNLNDALTNAKSYLEIMTKEFVKQKLK